MIGHLAAPDGRGPDRSRRELGFIWVNLYSDVIISCLAEDLFLNAVQNGL